MCFLHYFKHVLPENRENVYFSLYLQKYLEHCLDKLSNIEKAQTLVPKISGLEFQIWHQPGVTLVSNLGFLRKTKIVIPTLWAFGKIKRGYLTESFILSSHSTNATFLPTLFMDFFSQQVLKLSANPFLREGSLHKASKFHDTNQILSTANSYCLRSQKNYLFNQSSISLALEIHTGNHQKCKKLSLLQS